MVALLPAAYTDSAAPNETPQITRMRNDNGRSTVLRNLGLLFGLLALLASGTAFAEPVKYVLSTPGVV